MAEMFPLDDPRCRRRTLPGPRQILICGNSRRFIPLISKIVDLIVDYAETVAVEGVCPVAIGVLRSCVFLPAAAARPR